jgi:peptidoglycan/xylan/chitin deacetylase (PgdA/CDA1 family)
MSATPSVAQPSSARLALRIIKLGIGIAYLAARSAWRWATPLGSGTGVVLYYHSVPREYEDRFEEQMKMLTARARAVPLAEIDHLPNGVHSAAITFDDGLVSFAEHAVPVLERWNIPATVFAVVDALGTTPTWGAHYYTPEERVMSEEQLGALPALISVGSHTLTHPHLLAVSEQAAMLEISASRRKLESLLQRPVMTFSFPHGEFNEAVVAQCRDSGYERVFTTVPELLHNGQSKFVVGRIAADPWDWTLEFKLKMLGGYCWQSYLPSVKSVKRSVRRVFSRQKESGPSQRRDERPLNQSTHIPRNS